MSSVNDNTKHTQIRRQVATGNNPRSVGVIMDGNRRWAQRHGLPEEKGYQRGYKKLSHLWQWAKEEQLTHLTVYTLSTESRDRSGDEVEALTKLFRDFFRYHVSEARKHDIRVSFIGERHSLPNDIQTGLNRIEKETRNNTGLHFTVAGPYNGRAEIVDAFARAHKEHAPKEITEEVVERYLWTNGSPHPDLIIRTGGRRHLSSFLLWQAAESELFFTDTLWPDFTQKEFTKILYEYSLRKRIPVT